ncbi:MAG TPA: hypothetical protein VGB52_07925 [Actinomycetota bacterium]
MSEQLSERLRQISPTDALVEHVDSSEEGLIEPPPQLRSRCHVRLLATTGELHRLLERPLNIGEPDLGELQDMLGLFDLGGDPILLAAQEVNGNSTGVMGLE